MEKYVLGTMNIAYPHSSSNKTYSEYKEIIKHYLESTRTPILDSAYYYGNKKTEQILGLILDELSVDRNKIKITTKANPWFENDFTNGKLGQLSKEGLEKQLSTSLDNWKTDRVDVFFLHCPDYETPIEETLEACEELWRKEKFNSLGISNFSKEQTREIIEISEKNGYKQPSVYQGMYNLISRKVEELFPLLDENNMDFWAYNPLAGGLLSGKYIKKDLELVSDSRFKNNSIYQNIFWKQEILETYSDFFHTSDCLETSFHWLEKYSSLRPTDKIILGVSTKEQLKSNINIVKKNWILYSPLKLYYLDSLYKKIEDSSPNYYY